jgi:hypothetical protein
MTMGWDFCSEWTTVAKARAAYTAGITGKVLASKVTNRGRTLWSVVERPTGEKFIDVAIFEYEKEETSRGKRTVWGVKSMYEEMGPYYYDCPVNFLDMAPETCPTWRAKVRETAARGGRSYEPGSKVRIFGKDYVVVGPHTSTSRGGWDVKMVVNDVVMGKLYRAKPETMETV